MDVAGNGCGVLGPVCFICEGEGLGDNGCFEYWLDSGVSGVTRRIVKFDAGSGKSWDDHKGCGVEGMTGTRDCCCEFFREKRS